MVFELFTLFELVSFETVSFEVLSFEEVVFFFLTSVTLTSFPPGTLGAIPCYNLKYIAEELTFINSADTSLRFLFKRRQVRMKTNFSFHLV